MNTKSKIKSISKELDRKYGVKGTPERAKFDEDAYTFYTGQILQDARKNAKITQGELAEQLGTDTAYISRIEKGQITPSVATFFRIANILGFNVEMTPKAV